MSKPLKVLVHAGLVKGNREAQWRSCRLDAGSLKDAAEWLEHYRHFFGTPLYGHVLLTTLRISLVTTGVAIALGYPIALVMVRTNPVVSRILTMIVIAPLIVSVVVRTYGWQLILANGKIGILNWLLLATGHEGLGITTSLGTAELIADLDAQAMTRYAAETFQDPKVVKATCRKGPG